MINSGRDFVQLAEAKLKKQKIKVRCWGPPHFPLFKPIWMWIKQEINVFILFLKSVSILEINLGFHLANLGIVWVIWDGSGSFQPGRETLFPGCTKSPVVTPSGRRSLSLEIISVKNYFQNYELNDIWKHPLRSCNFKILICEYFGHLIVHVN